jgi:hypothetical protein
VEQPASRVEVLMAYDGGWGWRDRKYVLSGNDGSGTLELQVMRVWTYAMDTHARERRAFPTLRVWLGSRALRPEGRVRVRVRVRGRVRVRPRHAS